MIEVIIVGQGLAGSILGLKLLEKGKRIKIIDSGINLSSRIAGGIINPITGRRYVRSWNYSLFLSEALSFYKTFEKNFSKQFFHSIPIGKVLTGMKEKNEFISKNEESLEKLIKYQKTLPSHIKYKKEDVYFINGYWLDTCSFLESCKEYFFSLECLSIDNFKYSDLSFSGNNISYKNIRAEYIIFCEGYHVLNNPYFNWLPWQPTKGEIIELKTKVHQLNSIIQKQKFLLPVSENIIKVGSNYERDCISATPTAEIKDQLCSFFEESSSLDYEITNHKAGVRPSTKDRRPFIGLHPKNNKIGLFNGFGSKAVYQCPYLAKTLMDYLFEKIPLSKEIDIQRYIKYFSSIK